jgi:NNP family nitrate/nitrite transporter-like MFS transporter
MIPDPDTTSFRSTLPTVIQIASVSFLFFLSRSAMSPLLIAVADDFSLNYGTVSRAFAVYTIGYGITVFLSGFLSRSVTFRRLLPVAGIIGVIGLVIVALAPDVVVLQTGLFIFGVGFGLEAPTAISMIASTVRRREWQRAMSIHEISPHLGMILAPLGVVVVRSFLDWRGVFGALAIILGLQAVWFHLSVKRGDEFGDAPSISVIGTLVRRVDFWLLIFFFALALASTDGIYLLIPAFLVVDAGLSPSVANMVFGISRVLPIVALFVSALVADRLGPRRTIVLSIAGTGIAVIVMGASGGILRVLMVFLQPSLGALFFPAGFSALAALTPGGSRNVGISMVLPLAVIFGVGVVPALVGHMGDTVSFSQGFVVVGSVMVVAGAIAPFAMFRAPSSPKLQPRP